MTRTPEQDRAEFIAAQVTKALEATAVVIQISQSLLAQMADNAAIVSQLKVLFEEARKTLDDCEKVLFRGEGSNPRSVMMRIGSLEESVHRMEATVNRIQEEANQAVKDAIKKFEDEKKDDKKTDKAGQWNLKVELIKGAVILLGMILSALLGYYFSKPAKPDLILDLWWRLFL